MIDNNALSDYTKPATCAQYFLRSYSNLILLDYITPSGYYNNNQYYINYNCTILSAILKLTIFICN